jgi:hypothetical protein
MSATPDREGDAVRLYMAQVRQATERTRGAVESALKRSRAIREEADAAVQRAEARLKWVKAAKQRLADRAR